MDSDNLPRNVSATMLRRRISQIIDEIEHSSQPVVITRYGKPVAVMLSAKAYVELTTQRAEPDFQTAYRDFRTRWSDVDLDDAADPWDGIRDKTPGKEDGAWRDTP
ncbi:MAG: type II toxin-antitoxin system Phd/YefM family antitoxin [Anaerolineae bacterium]|nr:type II toxin-antitoxin system Phd/YefM family antitoxin [Anaerolineae bacterium]MCO5205651.1 type II toxin-antitoxin system Phd/YefM family antitoxin [Anaerolineae bacterium]